jgi:hypothetical protein
MVKITRNEIRVKVLLDFLSDSNFLINPIRTVQKLVINICMLF